MRYTRGFSGMGIGQIKFLQFPLRHVCGEFRNLEAARFNEQFTRIVAQVRTLRELYNDESRIALLIY
ncbi:hypothetical protein NDU88_005863 [Pleurodeles waltl]|uniref:Uncharacterized protein n=1 Tax=Pleurodeles waltl TaxID=8319 RepID=A0AAV7PGM7_PLEWA|nr:hypothetical protein NDU88_005863 [Pleurodeles waltl]